MTEFEIKLLQLVGGEKGTIKTPVLTRATGPGTNIDQIYSFSIANVGSGNATVLGTTLKPGETISDSAGIASKFDAGVLTYDGTGTELLIGYVK